jgi:hypothetical protein
MSRFWASHRSALMQDIPDVCFQVLNMGECHEWGAGSRACLSAHKLSLIEKGNTGPRKRRTGHSSDLLGGWWGSEDADLQTKSGRNRPRLRWIWE